MKKLFEQALHFGIVGVINTIMGFVLVMTFFNILHWDYWIASATSYVIGSIFSYFANKKFTFQAEQGNRAYVVKFAVNIAVCYLIAYGTARPLVRLVLTQASQELVENVAIILATGVFIVLNFFGQKFLVFTKKKERE